MSVGGTWTFITSSIRLILNHFIYRFIGSDAPNDGWPEREIFTYESMAAKLHRSYIQIKPQQTLPVIQLTFPIPLIPIIQISAYIIFFLPFLLSGLRQQPKHIFVTNFSSNTFHIVVLVDLVLVFGPTNNCFDLSTH